LLQVRGETDTAVIEFFKRNAEATRLTRPNGKNDGVFVFGGRAMKCVLRGGFIFFLSISSSSSILTEELFVQVGMTSVSLDDFIFKYFDVEERRMKGLQSATR